MVIWIIPVHVVYGWSLFEIDVWSMVNQSFAKNYMKIRQIGYGITERGNF